METCTALIVDSEPKRSKLVPLPNPFQSVSLIVIQIMDKKSPEPHAESTCDCQDCLKQTPPRWLKRSPEGKQTTHLLCLLISAKSVEGRVFL